MAARRHAPWPTVIAGLAATKQHTTVGKNILGRQTCVWEKEHTKYNKILFVLVILCSHGILA